MHMLIYWSLSCSFSIKFEIQPFLDDVHNSNIARVSASNQGVIDCSVSPRWMEGQHKFPPLFEQPGNNVHLITTPFRTFATEKI